MRAVFRALEGKNPRERMNPARPSLGDDPLRFVGYRNSHVMTEDGAIDFLRELTGLGSFERVAQNAVDIQLGGSSLRVIGIVGSTEPRSPISATRQIY